MAKIKDGKHMVKGIEVYTKDGKITDVYFTVKEMGSEYQQKGTIYEWMDNYNSYSSRTNIPLSTFRKKLGNGMIVR